MSSSHEPTEVSHSDEDSHDKTTTEKITGGAKSTFSFIIKYWYIFVIILVIIVVVSFIRSASNSPFWDLFKNLFGFADTAAAAVSDILGKCTGNPINLINPASGCFIAYFAIGGLLLGAIRVGAFFSKPKSPLIEENMKLTNRSGYEVIRDFKNKYKQES